jgi:hypothetical protein
MSNIQLDEDLFSDSKLDQVKNNIETKLDTKLNSLENPQPDTINMEKPDKEMLNSILDKFKNMPPHKRMEAMRLLRKMQNINPENNSYETLKPMTREEKLKKLRQKREDLKNGRTSATALEYRTTLQDSKK